MRRSRTLPDLLFYKLADSFIILHIKGAAAVVTDRSTMSEFASNIEMIAGSDFAHLAVWPADVAAAEAFQDQMAVMVRTCVQMEETLQAVALARRFHQVWYASFAWRRPDHTALGPHFKYSVISKLMREPFFGLAPKPADMRARP